MTRQEIIRLSVFGLLIVAIATIVIMLLTNKPIDTSYKELIKAKDETIKAIQEQRDIYKTQNEQLQDEINDHFKNDSILLTKSKQATVRYEKIPVYINSLDKDRLRAAVTSYAEQ